MKRVVPANISRLMSPESRKALGVTTPEESYAKAEAQSEKYLQEQICYLLWRKEIPFIRPAMFKRSTLPVGWPDFSLAWNGRPIAFECKVGNRKLTPEQEQMRLKLQRCGWSVYVIRSLQQAQEVLSHES